MPLYRHFADLAGNDKLMMPVPCFNVINGGSHAGNKLAFQEYFVIPTGAANFAEGMQIGTEVYHNLAKILKKKFGGDSTLIGDEGGFAPPCDCRSGLELIVEAIEAAGYSGKCTVGLDVAASEFKVKDSGTGADAVYDLGMWDAKPELISGGDLMAMYKELAAEFPIVTIEDGFDEDDWPNWASMVETMGEKVRSLFIHSEPFSPYVAPHLPHMSRPIFPICPESNSGSDRRRRSHGDKPGEDCTRSQGEERERASTQGEPDRLSHRGHPGGQGRQGGWLGRDDIAPLGRD